MALEILSEDIQKEIENKIKEKENMIGCHIIVDNDLVKITIEPHQDIKEEKVLTFSKREIKKFLQDIYVS